MKNQTAIKPQIDILPNIKFQIYRALVEGDISKKDRYRRHLQISNRYRLIFLNIKTFDTFYHASKFRLSSVTELMHYRNAIIKNPKKQWE